MHVDLFYLEGTEVYLQLISFIFVLTELMFKVRDGPLSLIFSVEQLSIPTDVAL